MSSKSLFAFAAGILLVCSVGPSSAKVRRADTNGGDWAPDVVATPLRDVDLLALPVNWPTSRNGIPLRVNPLGLVPSAFDSLPIPPNYIAAGWNVSNAATVTVVNSSANDKAFDDAQVLTCFAEDIDSVLNCSAHFANAVVRALDIEWRSGPDLSDTDSAYAQVMYFDLSSAPADVDIYDASGQLVGKADGAWEIEFNCATPEDIDICPNPASLEWDGQIYTATREVLTTLDPSLRSIDPDDTIDPRLNEFVFNAGTLYPPPGWLAATSTALMASATPLTIGDSLTLVAKVSVVNAAMPAGQITFKDGNALLGTAQLNTSGIATFITTTLPEGTHNITATYDGNAKSATSNSTPKAVVVNAPPPTLTLGANPTTIPLGQNVTLTWQSTNATTCTASNAWTGPKAVTSTQVVTPAAAGTLTYALACSGSGGNISRTVDVTVQPLPTAALSVAPTSITEGQSATLTWSSTNATGCAASGAWAGNQATSGTSNVTPAIGTYSYTLACTGPGGTANASATLTVNKKGGGGGALSQWEALILLLLLALSIRRRVVPQIRP